MSSTVHLRYLGEPLIELDGLRLTTPIRKAEALLFYIASEGRTPRERLGAIFWRDKDDGQASNNLRNCVYLLKKALPLNFIADRRFVSLVDFCRDIDAIDDISDPSVRIPPGITNEPLRGLEMPDLPEFEEWLSSTRSLIRKKIALHLRDRIVLCYERRMSDELVDSLETLLRAEPFDEDSVLELMEAYCDMGRPASAVSLFVTYRERLRVEIGIEPSERAEEYFARLVVAQKRRGGVMRPDEFFCGREDELKRILSVASDSKSGLSVLLLHGEAGVGKTALLERAIGLLRGVGGEVFSSRPQPVGEKYPYSSLGGLVSVIGARLAEKKIPIDASAASILSENFYEFAAVYGEQASFGTVGRDASAEARSPVAIARILCSMVKKIAQTARPIFVFEDLHWFDPRSLSLLRAFLSEMETPAVVFLTSRPESASALSERMYGLKPIVRHTFVPIEVKPFSPKETLLFCRSCLPGEVISRRGEDYFVRESEGMPLLLVEMFKILSENPDADCSAGLKGVIMSRMEDMTALQREVLRTLSVFGQGASPDELAAVMEYEPGELVAPLEVMCGKNLVREKREGDRFVLEFLHANVRECVYDSIPGFKREELHRRIARLLSSRYSPHSWNPELGSLIRYHWKAGNRPSQVLKQNLREMAFHIALNHVLFPMVQDRVLLSCRVPFSGREETEYRIRQVRDLMREIGEEDEDYKWMEASYLELWGGYMINWGEYREGRALINRSLAAASGGEHEKFDEIRVHCLEHIGHHFLQTDDAPRLLANGREILNLARSMGSDNHFGLALRFIGMAYLISGDFERAERVFRRSIEVFEDLAVTGRVYTLNMLAPRCYIGEMKQWAGKLDEAMREFRYCIDRCLEAGLFWGRSHFHAHAADVAFDMGDRDAFESHIGEGVELFESSNGGHCGSLLYSLKAVIDASYGRADDALASLKHGDWLSAISKKSWCAAHFMAKAFVAVGVERGELAREPFADYLDKPATLYAEVAEGLYREIGAERRAAYIRGEFGL